MKKIFFLKDIIAFCLLSAFFFPSCSDTGKYPVLDAKQLARQYYGEDGQWYLDNIPFFECSDKQIEQVYYYRWKLYKAHIRNVGDKGYVITEFINHVSWDREPYCTINAASMHHIYEGRWLKDNRYMDGYINYLFQDGGNDRRYSESIADAAYARYLVNADPNFLMKQLDSMKQMYNEWSDHFDSSKNLYYIPAMPDATEYTIASIDASGGKDGFDDGEAFRPTINSYMYANAMAISQIAAMKGDMATSNEYLQRAKNLKTNVEHNLWNQSLQHFTDRFKVNNQYVRYWDFIRGRELAGLIPWYFDLPSDTSTYSVAWKHVIDTSQLLGQYGLRTNEPSYQYYFKQFVIYQGKPGSQWNGPSWPYQTSQVLTGMANLLNDYKQDVVSASDYLKILRLFTRQHYLPDGKLDLVEDYDPNKGGPIVFYYWSNHYNHSSYNNLVISGLCGIRPSKGDTLVINPLIDNTIKYFCLQDVPYHGHQVTVVYDKEGDKYKMGKGLTVFVDGKESALIKDELKYRIVVGPPVASAKTDQPVNIAVNLPKKGYPVPSASVNSVPDSLYQAIDGRIWYFHEIMNRWSTLGTNSNEDWFALDFGQPKEISMVKIYPYADDKDLFVPEAFSVEYQHNGEWLPVSVKGANPSKPVANTVNTIVFDKISAAQIRIKLKHNKSMALAEVECY